MMEYAVVLHFSGFVIAVKSPVTGNREKVNFYLPYFLCLDSFKLFSL